MTSLGVCKIQRSLGSTDGPVRYLIYNEDRTFLRELEGPSEELDRTFFTDPHRHKVYVVCELRKSELVFKQQVPNPGW